MIPALPNEILYKVFDDLPLYNQRKCLQVCRSWYSFARAFTNDDTRKAEIRGTLDAKNLIQELSTSPTRGLSIRQMHFNLKDWIVDYTPMYEIVSLLSTRCPNLAELTFTNIDSAYLIMRLFKVDLPKIEVIRFGRNDPYPGYLEDRATLSFMHRKTINQLCISINKRQLASSRMNHIEDYVQCFTNLKCLSLSTSCPVVFDALVKACPQLQVLKLELYYCTAFQVMQGDNAGNQGTSALEELPGSRLETLNINHHLMNRELYRYLRRCCKNLTQLVLFIDRRKNISPLIDTFDVFQTDALPLTCITLNGDLTGASALAQGLIEWFPGVNQVDIGCFNPKDAFRTFRNYYNFFVDIDEKSLLCLSVNLSSFFDGKIGPVERIALEIITENAVVWYQREGKWDADTRFSLKDSEEYTSAFARETRMTSHSTAVISVNAQSIQMLYIYFESRQHSFVQVIHLNQ